MEGFCKRANCGQRTWLMGPQVVAPSTSRSTPALLAATLLLRPGSVRDPALLDSNSFPSSKASRLTRHSQLGREGQAQEDHRLRPHALPQDRQPQVLQRFPHWCRPRRQGPQVRINISFSSEGEEPGVDGVMKSTRTGA